MKFFLVLFGFLSFGLSAQQEEMKNKYITKPYVVPYERPIGFSFNLAGITSMTFEGRFLLGLARNFSLVVSPSYQNTIEFPFYHPEREEMNFFAIKRFNLGAGIRTNFHEYDSLDGWYIEALGRAGMSWIGQDEPAWALTPSLMIGYETTYDFGYLVSFGVGFEWEFLLSKKEKMGYYTDYLTSAYYGITKIPIMAELSVGWLWW